jgi:hypothetical protein
METIFQYRVLCSRALLCIISWIHTVDALPFSFYDIRFNIIRPF